MSLGKDDDIQSRLDAAYRKKVDAYQKYLRFAPRDSWKIFPLVFSASGFAHKSYHDYCKMLSAIVPSDHTPNGFVKSQLSQSISVVLSKFAGSSHNMCFSGASFENVTAYR